MTRSISLSVSIIVKLLVISVVSVGFVLFSSQSIFADDNGDEPHTSEETGMEEAEANDASEPSEESEQETEAESGEAETQVTAPTGSYSYVAQAGDSYSLMVRKAIQTYGIVNEVDLSLAQIIYAETNITLAASSPELTVGQNVTIDIAVVADWVEKAQALDESAEAAWQVYVPGADFNTNSVGEAR